MEEEEAERAKQEAERARQEAEAARIAALPIPKVQPDVPQLMLAGR